MKNTLYLDFINWLREDAPHGDLTTELLLDRDVEVYAVVYSRSEALVACIEDLVGVLEEIGLNVLDYKPSGVFVKPGDRVLEIKGSAKKILLIERTLLNLLMYLFGVATTTYLFVREVEKINPRIRVAATRKVLPGLRYLVKKAVRIGGGDTHRFSLSDAVLIKDNHLKIIGSVREAVEKAKRKSFIHRIEVEVESLEDAIEAAKAGVDVVMLDNMSFKEARRVVEELKRLGLRDKVLLEISGGVTLDNIREYASLDVDVISTSIITFQPVKIDLSLEIIEVYRR
ncbi:MAG: nicotinate-nucleotide diphosphorylase (carboxylating) [Desulfurococcales archaeon ex4484_58]|nr:MAG: nicotinate-nucleotide diphosphorylase (carboxylating) [Desulfurococcales archaeon ex4484_58]